MYVCNSLRCELRSDLHSGILSQFFNSLCQAMTKIWYSAKDAFSSAEDETFRQIQRKHSLLPTNTNMVSVESFKSMLSATFLRLFRELCVTGDFRGYRGHKGLSVENVVIFHKLVFI